MKKILLTLSFIFILLSNTTFAQVNQKSYQEVEEKLKNILPKDWTIISNPNEFILSRDAEVKFYNDESMYDGEKIEDRAKAGFMKKFEIKLALSPLVKQFTYNKIKSTNDKIVVDKGTPIKQADFYINNRGALQAYDSKYNALPDYYGDDFSIYCYTTCSPFLCIWPEEVETECYGIIEKIGKLFKKY